MSGSRNTKEKAAFRRACLSKYGCACEVCGFSFPEMARSTVSTGLPPMEVHHVWHYSKGGPNTVDNGTVLCPNCHALAHMVWPEKRGAESLTRGIGRIEFLETMKRARFGGEPQRQLPLIWGDRLSERLRSTTANLQDFLVEAWHTMNLGDG